MYVPQFSTLCSLHLIDYPKDGTISPDRSFMKLRTIITALDPPPPTTYEDLETACMEIQALTSRGLNPDGHEGADCLLNSGVVPLSCEKEHRTILFYIDVK
jgi:hypothetical protein